MIFVSFYTSFCFVDDFVQLVKSSEKLVALLNQLSGLENETVKEQVKLIKDNYY